ncbi:MAG: mercuric reductase [Candidatus Hydrogenedentes bacterium]|nr:mercuric reductase [Candidatus Hydrogenedentota bacterium]
MKPLDKYNEALLAKTHPADWQNPKPNGRYNLVVIGAGTAGLVTAAGAAGLGAKVALIERGQMGGDCLNYGCVPSKALIKSASVAAAARRAGDYGVRVPDGVDVDFAAVMERMRRLRAEISHNDSAPRFRDLGVDVFLGEGRFVDGETIEVAGERLRFKKAVIATGTRAAVPQIDGLNEAGYLTNETLFDLTERPKRLLVLGGGPIGCEMAQAFQRLGAQVHLIERGTMILPREDRDAAMIVKQSMERDGVQFHLEARTTRVEVLGDTKRVHLEHEGKASYLDVDAILVAVGRTPNLEILNLEAAQVKYGRQGVEVDDRLQTTNKRIFAAGDCCMKYKFTHAADFAARTVIQNALFKGRKKLSGLTMPWCTYTDPEIAHVGLSEAEAAEQGIAIDTFTVDMSDVDRAILEGETEGLFKVHVAKGRDTVLGATLVSAHAGESISEVTMAMAHEIGLGKMASVIHPYPTQADAIRKAGDLYNRTRLTPKVAKLFAWWMKMQR